MKLSGDLKCPECGGEIAGTVDRLMAVAKVFEQAPGEYEYEGDTEVDWDSQENVASVPGKVRVQCREAHEWTVTVEDGEPADPRVESAIEQARERTVTGHRYGPDDLEIDDEPAVSVADGGVWVAAWVWVEDEERELCEGCGEELKDGEVEHCAECVTKNEQRKRDFEAEKDARLTAEASEHPTTRAGRDE